MRKIKDFYRGANPLGAYYGIGSQGAHYEMAMEDEVYLGIPQAALSGGRWQAFQSAIHRTKCSYCGTATSGAWDKCPNCAGPRES